MQVYGNQEAFVQAHRRRLERAALKLNREVEDVLEGVWRYLGESFGGLDGGAASGGRESSIEASGGRGSDRGGGGVLACQGAICELRQIGFILTGKILTKRILTYIALFTTKRAAASTTFLKNRFGQTKPSVGAS